MKTNEELLKLYQDGNKEALDKLLENNQGIIAKLTQKYMWVNKRLEFNDLFNSGVVGFITAARKYDFDNKNRANFISYAVYYIDREIQTCVNGHSDKEIKNNKLFNDSMSLSTPVGTSDNNSELEDLIESNDNNFEKVENKIFIKQLRKELETLMKDRLTLVQSQIVKYRYGWNTKPMTFTEIGEILDIKNRKVNDMEYRALGLLRHSTWSRTVGREYSEQVFGPLRLTYYDVDRKLTYFSN